MMMKRASQASTILEKITYLFNNAVNELDDRTVTN